MQLPHPPLHRKPVTRLTMRLRGPLGNAKRLSGRLFGRLDVSELGTPFPHRSPIYCAALHPVGATYANPVQHRVSVSGPAPKSEGGLSQ